MLYPRKYILFPGLRDASPPAGVQHDKIDSIYKQCTIIALTPEKVIDSGKINRYDEHTFPVKEMWGKKTILKYSWQPG